MPSTEAPSYSSSRVQRAYRINGIEQCRLGGKLHLLDKQKVHQIRLTNQDIRMISLSLDYIQSSSGKSPEGVPPEEERPKSESEEESESEDEETGPCFMYGERIVSRKVRRVGRPLSAVDRKPSRRGSIASTLSDSVASSRLRPQSSPARRKPAWLQTSGDDSDKYSDSGSERTDVTGNQSPKFDWERGTTEVTKKILRAQAQKRKDPRRSLPSAIRRHSAFNDMPPSPVSLSPAASRSPSPNLYPPRKSQASPPMGRSARLSEILNQRRPTMSANAWRNHLNQAHSTPLSMTAARQQARDTKMKENETARMKVQARVQGFIDAYPLKRSNNGS